MKKNKLSSRVVFDFLCLMVDSSLLSSLQDRFSAFARYHNFVYDIGTCLASLFLDFLSWDYLQKEYKNV